MHEAYDYWTVRAERDAIGALRTFVRDDLIAHGAIGAWAGAGSIGWFADEFVALLSPSTDRDPFAGVRGIVDRSLERLEATARPTSPVVLHRDASVFAHRWFELATADWDEFLDLSTGAWPAFESKYGARIEGLFRARDASDDAPTTRALLITRYPTLAAWQDSRVGAGEEQRFLRRHELTRRSIVRVGWLL